jgi:TetR/AcrR family transcriptional regulator, transcriptional repressor for nem operon
LICYTGSSSFVDSTRDRLFGATISTIAAKGYAATAVGEICAKAGVTKGAFFHHYPSKESLTVAAVNDWAQKCAAFYASAAYHQFDDPLDRVLGFLDFRKDMLRAPMALLSCPVGTMIQEVFETHPGILRACEECISGQVADVQSDIAAAIEMYGIRQNWTAESLAIHTHTVLQGIYILAKARGNVQVAEQSIDHLRSYVELLFPRLQPSSVGKKTSKEPKATIPSLHPRHSDIRKSRRRQQKMA